MEDSGNFFFYAALIVIAFISWVVGKIREAIDSFRERNDSSIRPRRTDVGPPTSSAANSGPAAPQVSQRDRAREAMRETYRALGIPFPEDEETAPAQPAAPPPPPARQQKSTAQQARQKVTPSSDRLSADERRALQRLQQGKKTSLVSPARSGRQHGGRSTPGARELRHLLRNRSAFRKAILLKEILDKPKSLQ